MSTGKLIKLVTLDITNTLIRVAGSQGRQYAYIALKHGLDLDEKILTCLFLKYYKEYSKKYPNFGNECMMSAYTWWTCLVKDCFRSADAGISEDVLSKVADDLYIHYTTPKAWEFLPGAFEAIKDLRQYPVKIGVISNWDHRLYKVLQALNLRPYFDFVLPSAVIGVQKPDSAIFQHALQNAGCLPHESVHCGDSFEKDFQGARNVGMNAYLLTTTSDHHPFTDPNLIVETVQEFIDIIRPQLGDKTTQAGLNLESRV